jgi:hypothetical protein
MRKESTKKLDIPLGHTDAYLSPEPPMRYVNVLDESLKDILLRICDACHDIDNRTEPWVSIRRDIQRLK